MDIPLLGADRLPLSSNALRCRVATEHRLDDARERVARHTDDHLHLKQLGFVSLWRREIQ